MHVVRHKGFEALNPRFVVHRDVQSDGSTGYEVGRRRLSSPAAYE